MLIQIQNRLEKLTNLIQPHFTEKMTTHSSDSAGKSFIVKLHKILHNPDYFDVIDWTGNGRSIIVKSIPEMMEKVLPAVYKHKNYSSFIRQLNTYGFNKVTSPEGQHIYHHDYFSKHERPDYSMIYRKTVQKDREVSTSSEGLGIRELVMSLGRRVEELEERLMERETEREMVILKKLRHLEEMNSLLEKRSQQQERQIARIITLLPDPTPSPHPAQKPAQIHPPNKQEPISIKHEDFSSQQGANTSQEKYWSGIEKSSEMAEIFSNQAHALDSLDLLCEGEGSSQNFGFI